MNWKDPEIFISESERVETSILEKSPGCLNCISFLPGPGITTKENQQTVSPPFWFVCLPFHSIGELIHLSSLSLTRAVASCMVTALDSSVRALARDIVMCAWAWYSSLTMPLSILNYTWGGLLIRGFSVIIDWSSIERYHQYRLISIYRLLFSIDWTLRDMFVWVPSFPTQCLSRSCITYVFEMATVWAASSLYQHTSSHTSIGEGLVFRVTCW